MIEAWCKTADASVVVVILPNDPDLVAHPQGIIIVPIKHGVTSDDADQLAMGLKESYESTEKFCAVIDNGGNW